MKASYWILFFSLILFPFSGCNSHKKKAKNQYVPPNELKNHSFSPSAGNPKVVQKEVNQNSADSPVSQNPLKAAEENLLKETSCSSKKKKKKSQKPSLDGLEDTIPDT
ncbi:MAG: hypothetical protein D6785_02545 [Planctomycetota bacterium]|nr:MAG: hypothetical protein D6785_02545 [Planctomycetota bacterium]